jgi:hypothetical protein
MNPEPQFQLQIPESWNWNDHKVKSLSQANPDLRIEMIDTELAIFLSNPDQDWVEMILPDELAIEESMLDELWEENEHKIEADIFSPKKLYIQMATVEMIGAFTVILGSFILMWAKKYKKEGFIPNQRPIA